MTALEGEAVALCATSSTRIGIKLPQSATLKPAHFNRMLAARADAPDAELVNEVVLRSQAQAEYSTENIGHFGLNLRRYAHFTSPIRRYADLIVHRALVRALRLGDDGLTDGEMRTLARDRATASPTPSAGPWRPSGRRPTA